MKLTAAKYQFTYCESQIQVILLQLLSVEILARTASAKFRLEHLTTWEALYECKCSVSIQ